MTAAPHQCWCCSRTATFGTPAAADAVHPHLCPRCDHDYMHALAGGSSPFRGVDTPEWVAPSPAPAPLPEPSPVPGDAPFDAARAPISSAELTEVPVVWLPCEAGYEPEAPTSLDALLALATFLTMARWGVTARVGTDDGRTWQCVCRDPSTGATLDDHPSATGRTPEEAAQGLVDHVNELNLRDAGAPSIARAYPPPVPEGDDAPFTISMEGARALLAAADAAELTDSHAEVA